MKETQELALKRIKQLFKEASIAKKPERANRYVEIARKLAMKARIPIPRELKRKYCKDCYQYYIQGKTVRIRNHKGRVIYYCLKCKHYRRFIIKSLKKIK